MGLRRRAVLPEDVREGLDLGPEDRIMAITPLTDGWAVATARRLHVVPSNTTAIRRPWSDIAGARLDADAAMLTVTLVDTASPVELHLADGTDRVFADTVRQRIEASILLTERVVLPLGPVVRVVLRRGPDGTAFTQVLGDARVDLSDPSTATAVEAAEARVRETIGLR